MAKTRGGMGEGEGGGGVKGVKARRLREKIIEIKFNIMIDRTMNSLNKHLQLCIKKTRPMVQKKLKCAIISGGHIYNRVKLN